METALKNCPVEEKKKQEQFFDNVEKKINVINSVDDDLSSQLSMLLVKPEEEAEQKVCPEWIEPIKIACRNTEKYECGHSIGGVYCDRLLTQSHVEKILLESGDFLKELFLSEICKSSIMPIVAKQCENLTRLEFVHNGELKTNVNGYIEAFTKLKKLKFIKIHLINMYWCLRRKFPWEAINYLPEEINEIHLIDVQCLSKKPVIFDLKRFKNLYALTLSGCNLNNILHEISEKTWLIHLDITNSGVTKKCAFNIDNLFNQLVNLEHISMTMNKSTLNVPSCILKTCKNIRHLDLKSGGWRRQNEIEISIQNWDNLKNLEYLAIKWKITGEIAIQLVKYCKKLKYLDISGMPMDDTIQTALQELTKLENLECLKIGDIHYLYAETISAISNNCQKIKILKMRSDWCVTRDYRRPPHPPSILNYLLKLQYPEQLSLPSMITNESLDSSILAIVNTCRNLTKLDISHCRNITETSLIALTNFKSLKELKVVYIENVTDNFISKLKGLECFNCIGCKKVTDAGAIQLINNCPNLEYLNLHGTNVTTNTIIGASEATKNRRNDIILILNIERILRKSFKSLNKSIWLTLEY